MQNWFGANAKMKTLRKREVKTLSVILIWLKRNISETEYLRYSFLLLIITTYFFFLLLFQKSFQNDLKNIFVSTSSYLKKQIHQGWQNLNSWLCVYICSEPFQMYASSVHDPPLSGFPVSTHFQHTLLSMNICN